MLTLIIETSTERGLIALLDGKTLLFQTMLPFGYNNSKFLLPAIEAELKNKALTLQQLSLIAVGIGPGSYTGIRIGVVVAKTLAYALKKPLIGLCSLTGFIPDSDGPFAVLIDAKIGGVYLLTGEKNGEKISFTSQPEVCEWIHIKERLKGIKILVTPYSARIQPLMQTHYPELDCEWQEIGPSALQLGHSALEKFHQGEFSEDTHLDLLYLRKTQAEIEKGK
jgi:tRNA threonylcarbamoyl adenosine modification protein YeaZ